MTLPTLLLDLDDTLLDSNLEAFLPAYFQKLAQHLAPLVPPAVLLQALGEATRRMYVSLDLQQTLEQVFSSHFYPSLGRQPQELSAALEDFYDNVFPSLQPLTRPRPEAQEFVQWALEQGARIAIATDPLFPRKAILHRLRWAGMPPETFPFALISDFQSFHFAKASVAFYPEFLNLLGWEDEPALMIGDSLERDILPARKAGLPVYWLNPTEAASAPGGGFSGLKRFLLENDPATLKVNFSSPEALLSRLMGNAAALHGLTQKLTPQAWKQRPAPGEWAPAEIFCHLRDVEREVNLPRIQTILSQENPFLGAQVTDPWAEERAYLRQDGPTALRDFLQTRQQILNLLNPLSPQDWQRPARHTIFGPTTLQEMVGFLADHDRAHIRGMMD